MFLEGFCMFLIVPLVGPSAFGFVFVWFFYGFVRFSYCFNRPPRLSVGFRVRFRMVFLWFSYGFPMVLIAPLVGSSAFGIVFVWFSHGFHMVL